MDDRERFSDPPTEPSAQVDTPRDGRSERGARNRKAILDAVYKLVEREERMPTAERAADAAGVGIRTIFRHFSDMDALWGEVYGRLYNGIRDLAEAPIVEGTLEGRCTRVIERRCELFERVAPFRRAAVHIRHQSRLAQEKNEANQYIYRLRLLASFPELEGAPPALVEALDLLSSFEAWDRLKVEQGLSNFEARICLENAFTALMRESLH